MMLLFVQMSKLIDFLHPNTLIKISSDFLGIKQSTSSRLTSMDRFDDRPLLSHIVLFITLTNLTLEST